MKKTIFKTIIPIALLVFATLLIGSGCGDDAPCSTSTWYYDNDGDGFGDPDKATETCNAPDGYVSNNTDCDDSNETIYPNAVELCDGLDNNCDGEVDNSTTNCDGETVCVDGICIAATTFYKDSDNDGFGDPNTTMQGSGTPPEGWVTNNVDCDDSNDLVNILADEIMDNNIDDNCNGLIDAEDIRYIDNDGDGYGSSNEAAGNGVFNNLDCDDNNIDVHPYAIEIPGNNIDEDCDGEINKN